MPSDDWAADGWAVADRMRELRLTAVDVAAKASVHPSTVRALIHGTRRVHESTRDAIAGALGWQREELDRRTRSRAGLADYSTDDLIRELLERLNPDAE